MNETHVRIAITTNSLLQVDANFVAARQMVFYDVSESASEFVDVVHFSRSGRAAKKGPGGGKGCVMDDMENDDGTGFDPLVERVDCLDTHAILFTCGLSDLAAVRVHARSIFPVKTEKVRPIDDVIANVQRMMKGTPPLWMRRLLRGHDGNPMPRSHDQQSE